MCDGYDNNCNGIEDDSRDDRQDESPTASDWCRTQYDSASTTLYCDNDRGDGALCCDYDGDPDNGCDFESLCHDNVDDDGDGLMDCADADCLGIYCAPYKTCRSDGSCQ
jgi:hypothetical protein